jgi:DNA-binding MarR family transcriptional regulator
MTAAEKASAVLQETSATLNERSRKRFSSLLQKFIDGFAFSADTHHEVLDRLYLQLWQLNRAVGLTGENFLGSRLSISQVHVLTLLVEKQESMICARDIDDLLPFDASTISRIVARFEKNGWIKRSPLPGDKRSLALALTTAGLASVHQLHQAVRSAFDQALREFSPSDESEFIQLLDRLATSAESIVQSKRQQFLKPISDQVLNERRSAEPLTEILRRSAVSGAEFFAFEYARDCPAYCVVSEERGRKFALFAVPLDTSTGSESLTKAYRELVKADLRKRQ